MLSVFTPSYSSGVPIGDSMGGKIIYAKKLTHRCKNTYITLSVGQREEDATVSDPQ
jgi:hypothetical protein